MLIPPFLSLFPKNNGLAIKNMSGILIFKVAVLNSKTFRNHFVIVKILSPIRSVPKNLK